MKLTDFINKDAVCIDLKSKDKTDALYKLVDILLKSEEINNSNRDELFNILYEREKLGSTGVTNGAAIPHGKSDLVKGITVAIGIFPDGIDFDSLDGQKTCIFALLIAPSNFEVPHLRVLAKISRLFGNKTFKQALINAKSPEDVIKLIATEEKNFLRDQ